MQIFNEINWAVITPFLIIQFILTIIALIDWFKTEKTNGPKWIWLLFILFISILGPVLYFVIGRRQD